MEKVYDGRIRALEQLSAHFHTFLFSIKAPLASQRPLPSLNREPVVDEKESEACKRCVGGGGADGVMAGHEVVLLHKQTKL